MATEYQPLVQMECSKKGDAEEFEDSEEAESILDQLDSSGPPNLVYDTWWVYEHLDESHVVPADCPSLGAWSLLQWARTYRSRFFEQFLPKLINANDKSVPSEEVVRPARRSVEEIRAILRSFANAAEA